MSEIRKILNGMTVDELLAIEQEPLARTKAQESAKPAENASNVPAAQAAQCAASTETEKPVAAAKPKPQPAANERKRDLIDGCGEGLDRPSGRTVSGKYGFMG